ncbi:MAG: phage holin [Oscillospiraceae bacterium]|nr:phage holin [Candidatus Equicaccousia limihippi]
MKNIKKTTIVRTVVLLFLLLNQVLTVFGKNPLPFSEDAVYNFVSTVLTCIASVWAWWKNNSFTAPAIKADQYLQQLKEAKRRNSYGF